MGSNKLTIVPVLTTPAGSCLTGENWQAAGIHTASYHLSALLMKPGFEALKTFSQLAPYVGWEDKLILNAALTARDKEGRYALRSEYDGSRAFYTLEDILALVNTLQPNMVILPMGVSENNNAWQTLPDKIFPFFSVTDLPKITDQIRPYGVYVVYDKTISLSDFLLALKPYQSIPCYVMGDISLALMKELAHHQVTFVESDSPAREAYVGHVYSARGILKLEEHDYAKQFEVIDTLCKCPVCKQKFTKAYLHHLLEQTPLLCQRYLIQHNLYYCEANLSKECE